MQNFIKELSNYLENNVQFNDLTSENLALYNQKIIGKYKDKMLLERNNILQKYAENTQEKGEMYYIYSSNKDKYNISICSENQSHEIIEKTKQELPEGSNLGSVLRKQGKNFTLDVETTQEVEKEINKMIKEKIEEQNNYLESKRIEGHIYEVGEKSQGRIWLYDLNNVNNGEMEAIEEIEFPKNLYQIAKEGDTFIYKNGEYQNNNN